MHRLFTGLEVPRPIGSHLSLLRGGLQGARWIDEENYHITLRYMGEVDDRAAREIDLCLQGVHRTSFEVTVEELDVFGGDRPRSLIARVAPSSALIELQAEQERMMRRMGFAPETRKFTPHITLARLRDVSARAAADWLSMHGRMARHTFRAARFVLFSSRASLGGGPYLVEESYDLTVPLPCAVTAPIS